MKPYGGTIQMKPPQQYIHTVLFIHYVVLTFKCVGKILWCYHSNETSLVILSHGTIYFLGFYKNIYLFFVCENFSFGHYLRQKVTALHPHFSTRSVIHTLQKKAIS